MSTPNMPGTPIRLPDGWWERYQRDNEGTKPGKKQDILNLAECFRVMGPQGSGPGSSRKQHNSTGPGRAKEHGFSLTSCTAKAVGGSGKTTTMMNNIFGLVADKNRSVIVANLDAQPSLEERLLEKIVREAYGEDFTEFYDLNGLIVPEDLGGETDFDRTPIGPDNPARSILHALYSCVQYPPTPQSPMAGNVPLYPPKVIVVDIQRLLARGHASQASGRASTAFAYIIRSHENISKWGDVLEKARDHNAAPHVKNAPGALYHLMQACAYVYGAHEVLVDMGPGSGQVTSMTVMSSDALIMPANIDHKCRSTITSFANSLPHWRNAYGHVRAAGAPLTPPPDQTPKFVGTVFNRSGLGRGPVYSMARVRAMDGCLLRLRQGLMPTLRANSMAFLDTQYDQICVRLQNALNPVVAPTPQFPNMLGRRGVSGVMRDFDQLQELSESEGLVPAFLQAHHNTTSMTPVNFANKVQTLHNMAAITVDCIVDHYAMLKDRIQSVNAFIQSQVAPLHNLFNQLPTPQGLQQLQAPAGHLSIQAFINLFNRYSDVKELVESLITTRTVGNQIRQSEVNIAGNSAGTIMQIFPANYPATYPDHPLCSEMKKLYIDQDMLLSKMGNARSQLNGILGEIQAAAAGPPAAAPPAAAPPAAAPPAAAPPAAAPPAPADGDDAMEH